MRRRVTRDAVMFMVGLLGTVHETVLRQADRPFLLALFAAMMGLPAYMDFVRRNIER